MAAVVGQRPRSEEPFRRYEYNREPRGSGELPYTVSYPHRDERYEHEKRSHDNEMKLIKRVVERLGSERPRESAGEPARRIRELFDRLDSFGRLAGLVEELGFEVGLSKSWLRSEVLKSLGAESVYGSALSATFEGVEKAGCAS
jgi:hypothetical protein